jgi:cysteine-rich secretory family protein
MRKLIAVLVLGLTGLIAPLAIAPAAHADVAGDEAAFVAKINQLRASVGVGQLSVDGNLTSVARSWAQSMANAGTISHNPNLKNMVTGNWSFLGENVGVGPNVDSLFTAFVNSPHHYANLVDPRFTYVGVGVVWSGGTMYTSHEFMTLRGTPAPSVQPAVTSPPATAPRVTTPRAVTPRPAATSTTAPPATVPVATTVPAPVAPPVAPPEPAVVSDRMRMIADQLARWDPTRSL